MTGPRQPPRPMRVRSDAFELHKMGVARFDLRDPYHLAVTLSWPAFFCAAIGVLLLLNLIFATLYLLQPGAVQHLPPGDLLNAFFFSLESLATVGYGEMAPASTYGHAVAAVEIVVGMAFIAIFTGLLFVRFSRPKARILFAHNAVISNHNGQPTLMVRIANGRLTMLTHAVAYIAVLIQETTDEGVPFRRVVDLSLTRDTLPVFPLTWTLMHTLDETSPLHGMGPGELEAHQIRIFVAVEARDVALAAVVQDLSSFHHHQVLFGARYGDAVAVDDQGRVIADLGRLSDVVTVDPQEGDADQGPFSMRMVKRAPAAAD
jgi:inward rectifier potassium channel